MSRYIADVVRLDMIPWPQKEADRLERAAELITRLGWCQGQETDARGHIDIVRAYRMADPANPDAGYGLTAVSVVLDTQLSAADWQDANGRSSRDVVDALRLAARELRAADPFKDLHHD
jgi:hypothetical protein